MLNLYSIFVHYVLFFQKKTPPTPPHFPANVGSTPHTPPVWNRPWFWPIKDQCRVLKLTDCVEFNFLILLPDSPIIEYYRVEMFKFLYFKN